MKKILFIFLVLFATACQFDTKNLHELVRIEERQDFSITIDITNYISAFKSKVVLNNSKVAYYNLEDTKLPLEKPFTLYFISYGVKPDKEKNRSPIPIDTSEIPFSKDLSDTLFALTKSFLKSVDFNNYDTVGKSIPIITDDTQATVGLSFDGKTMTANISSINNPNIAPKQLDTLLNFINKFRSRKK